MNDPATEFVDVPLKADYRWVGRLYYKSPLGGTTRVLRAHAEHPNIQPMIRKGPPPVSSQAPYAPSGKPWVFSSSDDDSPPRGPNQGAPTALPAGLPGARFLTAAGIATVEALRERLASDEAIPGIPAEGTTMPKLVAALPPETPAEPS